MKNKIIFIISLVIPLVLLTSIFSYFLNDYKRRVYKKNVKDTSSYNEVRSMIYPVGSVYLSITDNTVAKVQARFGGTWEAFGTGKILVGVNSSDTDFSTVEKTGGVKTVNLSHSHTVNEHTHTISHKHTVDSHTHSLSNHTHTVNSHTHTLSNHTHTVNKHTHTLSSHTHGTSKLTAGWNSFTSGSRLYIDYNERGGTGYTENRRAYTASDVFNGKHSETNSVGVGIFGSTDGPSNNTSGEASPGTGGPSNNTSGAATPGTGGPSNNTSGAASPGTGEPTNANSGKASPGTDSKLSASQNIMNPYITVYMYKRTA